MTSKTARSIFFIVLWLPAFFASPAVAEPLPVVRAKHLYDITADFCHPVDLAAGPDGRVYILDGTQNRVVIHDPKTRQQTAFMTGSREEAGLHPIGLDVDSAGRIYVADPDSRSVLIFDTDGKRIRNIPLADPDIDPTDIVADPDADRCFVIDNDNHRIQIYRLSDSKRVDTWGESGEKPGQFQYPFLAARDRHATLYVVDVLNTRVQAISPEGRTMSVIGKWGVNRGQFYRPKGVAVAPNDRIYITDSYLGVVQVFKRYRKFIGVLADSSGNLLKLETPTGIAVDNNQRLYIMEMLRNRVSVYRIMD